MPLSAKQLLRSAWAPDREKAKDVKQVGHKKLKTKNKMLLKTLTYDMSSKQRRAHKQSFWCDEPGYAGKLSEAKALKVRCDCGRFCFYYEYALNKAGATDIYYSNGQPAIETNPRNKPGICKHLIVTLTWLITKKI